MLESQACAERRENTGINSGFFLMLMWTGVYQPGPETLWLQSINRYLSCRGTGSVLWSHNICDEPFNQHSADCLWHRHPKDIDIAQVGNKFVVWHDPTICVQKHPNPFLVDILILMNLKETKGSPGM